MADLEAALALAARREGKRAMPAAQWAFTLSLGLGWMTPAQARAFVQRALQAGILLREPQGLKGEYKAERAPAAGEQGDDRDEELRLAWEGTPNVPLGWRPDPAAGPEAAPDGFVVWLDRYAERAGLERAAALQRVSELQGKLAGMLAADAAVLWLAAGAGLDVREAARRLSPAPAATTAHR